jgi:hypothetical protein
MSYALLIGLNYSSTRNRLYGCINDCIRMQNILSTKYGFPSANIVFMRDDIYDSSHPLYPNKANMMLQMKNLFALSKTTGNLLYFHFSGHGSSIRDTNSDERDGFDEFIVPADYFVNGSKIIDDELLVLTRDLNPSIPCFMIFDSCHSGTILDLNWSYTLNKSTGLFIRSPGTLAPSTLQNSIICVSGCNDAEVSLDVFANGKYNGALSNGLYNVLAQVPAGQLISVGSVVVNIYKYLIKNSFKQNPIITTQLPLNINGVAFLRTTQTISSRTFSPFPEPVPEIKRTHEPTKPSIPEPTQPSTRVLIIETEINSPDHVSVDESNHTIQTIIDNDFTHAPENEFTRDTKSTVIISAEQTAFVKQITNLTENKLMTGDQIKALVEATLFSLE